MATKMRGEATHYQAVEADLEYRPPSRDEYSIEWQPYGRSQLEYQQNFEQDHPDANQLLNEHRADPGAVSWGAKREIIAAMSGSMASVDFPNREAREQAADHAAAQIFDPLRRQLEQEEFRAIVADPEDPAASHPASAGWSAKSLLGGSDPETLTEHREPGISAQLGALELQQIKFAAALQDPNEPDLNQLGSIWYQAESRDPAATERQDEQFAEFRESSHPTVERATELRNIAKQLIGAEPPDGDPATEAGLRAMYGELDRNLTERTIHNNGFVSAELSADLLEVMTEGIRKNDGNWTSRFRERLDEEPRPEPDDPAPDFPTGYNTLLRHLSYRWDEALRENRRDAGATEFQNWIEQSKGTLEYALRAETGTEKGLNFWNIRDCIYRTKAEQADMTPAEQEKVEANLQDAKEYWVNRAMEPATATYREAFNAGSDSEEYDDKKPLVEHTAVNLTRLEFEIGDKFMARYEALQDNVEKYLHHCLMTETPWESIETMQEPAAELQRDAAAAYWNIMQRQEAESNAS